MVLKNKFHRVIDKYRELLKKRAVKLKNKHGHHMVVKGNRAKNRILDFYLKNHRWPSRISKNKVERSLGTKFENYLSKEAVAYDSTLRRIALTSGRTTNNKRKHNVVEFKKEILEFLEKHNRVPSTSYKFQINEGEAVLRHKLDYYTKNNNDMTLLGKVYEIDRCHLSGIPSKFRSIINKNLDVEKPLIRLVKP